MSDRDSILEGIRKAKAEGKALPAFAEKLLAEATASAPGKLAGKGKMVAALYLLGASLRQLSDKVAITKATAYSYVRDNLPPDLRKLASEQRNYGLSGPLLESDMIDTYIAIFVEKKDNALRGMTAPQIASALKHAAPAPTIATESLDDPDGEPY